MKQENILNGLTQTIMEVAKVLSKEKIRQEEERIKQHIENLKNVLKSGNTDELKKQSKDFLIDEYKAKAKLYLKYVEKIKKLE